MCLVSGRKSSVGLEGKSFLFGEKESLRREVEWEGSEGRRKMGREGLFVEWGGYHLLV